MTVISFRVKWVNAFLYAHAIHNEIAITKVILHRNETLGIKTARPILQSEVYVNKIFFNIEKKCDNLYILEILLNTSRHCVLSVSVHLRLHKDYCISWIMVFMVICCVLF